MGHLIEYMDFPKKASKEDIFRSRAEFIEDNGDRDRGHLLSHDNGFTLHKDILCDTCDEAIEKIDSLDRGWYDDHGVLYKDYSKAGNSKAMQAMLDKRREIGKKKAEYISENHVKSRKSESVTCPKCKSRLTISYLGSDYCPLCRTDLRSDTVKNRIKSFDNRMAECDKKYEELMKKRKYEERWLVKLEIHV